MDCPEVRELLDAYALGAVEKSEAEALERHVADCLRCWEELSVAQRTTALLALSVPREEAPPRLRNRVMEQARREARPRATARLAALMPRLWPVGTGALAVSAVAALALAAFAQTQVDDMRDENSELARQVDESDALVGDQRQLMAVLAAPDLQQANLWPDDPNSQAIAVYYWSETTDTGFLVCNNLPSLPEGHVYQAWLVTDEGGIPVGSFRSWKGIGQLAVDLEIARDHPRAIAISIQGAEDEEAQAETDDGSSEARFLYGPLETGP